jgi:hypothetical protein
MIFTMDIQKANIALSKYGIQEGAEFSPIITVDEVEFLEFLD